MNEPRKKTILSGMRPTGKLHLGHWTGALENWVALQDSYENFHLVADYHALTTNLDTRDLYRNTIDMVIDWLAGGIDPVKSPIFRQSRIKEHTELHLIFSMLVTTSRLERNPSIKEQVRDLDIENITYGHLGYPVLQAADILLYRGDLVPVGEDQLSHVEITREIARRFNATWGVVFPEPEPKLTRFARLPGLDGKEKKMSKSMNNTLLLSDDPETVGQKLRKAPTDPLKVRRNDPGRPDVCLIFTYHEKFNPTETPEIRQGCESGALGCVDCKLRCGARINEFLAPHIARRREYEDHPSRVEDILRDGERRARARAEETMDAVRRVMELG
ncbi:MAG: tryptophan--tRNA ligase [Bacteroidota bacterium]|jgi:tryptophanyl-tRNA synthetase|nr:tryptophan--tRNA ligase [Bacteroidota bacterium]